MPNKRRQFSVGLVSLGCAKNAVDLQVMAGALLTEGIALSSNPDRADCILVNTCAFIEAARQEANDEILRACDLKRSGKARFVVVTGCLPQRYGASLAAKYPEVDGWLGIDHLFDLPALLRSLSAPDRSKSVASRPVGAVLQTAPSTAAAPAAAPVLVSTARNTLFEPPVPDFTITGGVHAFLKVADGCNHACAYCAIPAIRGHLRSRRPRDILAEARALVRSGIRELDVVAQDVTAYGRDLRDGTSLASLLTSLDRIRGDYWLRLLYGYPSLISDELLSVMASARHVCRYIDLPLQHSHPEMLRAMRRADTVRHIGSIVGRLRAAVPGIALRTTFIVGFPGETEAHFEHLLDFVRASEFDQLGVFTFSPEEGTPAAKMDGTIAPEVAELRRSRLMEAQQDIVERRLASMAGTRVRVLVEQIDGDCAVARAEFQAPDVDGATLIANPPASLRPGDFAEVEITGLEGYDLVAKLSGGTAVKRR